MERFLNAILLFVLFYALSLIYSQNASSQIIDDVRSIEPAIYNRAGNVIDETPKISFRASCVAVTTGKKLPCSHEVTILPPNQ